MIAEILNSLSWYISILIVGAVAFPIAFRFFAKLPGRGYALARPLGLLFWGYLFWVLCSFGVLQNNLGGVLMAFLILLGLSIWAGSNGHWKKALEWIKENKRTVLSMEILFFVAFALWIVVRAANPEVTYTEKPMELAFINSILKSTTFPPQDPWLSGYSISYYYFGYVVISMLIRVTGVSSAVAFNISSAMWFALTALAVYEIVFDLIAAKGRHDENEAPKHGMKRARIGGLLGPIFVLMISCLEGVLEFLYCGGVFWKKDASGNLTSKFWSWLDITDLNTAPATPFNWSASRSVSWQWWRGSRVIQDISLTGGKIEVIDEFPFFSYLLSDLHPHVLAMPFCLLAMGACLNLFLSAKEGSFAGEISFNWLKKWEFWLVALICGSLAFINTWDFPIYVALFCFILVFVKAIQRGWHSSLIWEFIKSGLFIGISGVLLFIPFYLGFQSQAGGLLPSMEYSTRGIHFWILFGALLAPILIWLMSKSVKRIENKNWKTGIKFAAILLGSLWLVSTLFGILIMGLNQLGIAWAASSSPVIAGLGITLQTAGQAFTGLHGTTDAALLTRESISRRLTQPGTWITLFAALSMTWALLTAGVKEAEPAEGLVEKEEIVEIDSAEHKLCVDYFVLILILVGIALAVFPEFFYLRDQFGTRMNTIFKFYFQTWMIWGVAAAYASVDLLTHLRGWKSRVFNTLWILLMLAGLAYPIIMLGNKTNHFNPEKWTLDGNEFISRYTPDEYLAMQWLNTEPLGVVAEAVGGSYTDYARVSTRTGFPTVLGWPGHESQWRGGYTEMGSRQSDIELLYETNSWTEAQYIIQKYNIKYIYVGNLEYTQYQTDIGKFSDMLTLVYENASVKIFEVPSDVGELSQ